MHSRTFSHPSTPLRVPVSFPRHRVLSATADEVANIGEFGANSSRFLVALTSRSGVYGFSGTLEVVGSSISVNAGLKTMSPRIHCMESPSTWHDRKEITQTSFGKDILHSKD